MLFVGDVAIAPGDIFTYEGFPDVFEGKKICPNLEGAIENGNTLPDFGLCNSKDWLASFSLFDVGPVFLANNHISDIPNGVERTLSELEKNGITSFGINGKNLVEDEKHVYIGFGWSVIGCDNGVGKVSELSGDVVLSEATKALALSGSKTVIVVMHWNYEFEKYPQPAHRKLAMDLIDMGVYAVIGHHPHIVSPVERYKGRTIAYSVGNWAFSENRFFSGRLRFPEQSSYQIAIELSYELGDKVHHLRKIPNNTIRFEGSEDIQVDGFSLKPEFEGFNDEEYLRWFCTHRKKRKFLPVYVSYRKTLLNNLKDKWVWIRQEIIDLFVKLGLKSTERNI